MSGPGFWGGATNKFAPGAFWNWFMLMQALGRRHARTMVRSVRDADILSLPAQGAPAITRLWKDQCAIAYDETEEFYLVFVVGKGYEQPYLPRGDYHWDGWVPKEALRPTEGPMFRVNAFDRSHGCVAYRRPLGRDALTEYGRIPNGKFVAGTGATNLVSPDMRLHEIFVYDSRAPDTLWIDAKSCEG